MELTFPSKMAPFACPQGKGCWCSCIPGVPRWNVGNSSALYFPLNLARGSYVVVGLDYRINMFALYLVKTRK
ncbi:similar to chromosome 16 open reading frame 33; minus -99 protein (predicted), isoform CRA_c, partial [Rattus norvegicus]